ncbi:MAG: UPF0236 family protein [bacterium]|nr:UPF0236 family protein [bacterium]
MEIISQNYNKILEDLIKNNLNSVIKRHLVNNVFNYIELISNIDQVVINIAKESLTQVIESLDRGFRNSRERINRYHIKARTTRTILTIFGEITYRKTLYINKYTNEYYCYIDEYLGLKKYDYFDPYIKAIILNYASDNSYGKTASFVNDLIGNKIKLDKPFKYISKQTIRNIVLTSTTAKESYKELETPDDIYIMADEKFVATQNNDNNDVMIKEIVVFDGRTTINGRTTLSNKYIFSSYETDKCATECLDYIYKVYNSDKLKNVFVMGDGAKWIKNLPQKLKFDSNINVSFSLDHFHFKQAIHHICLNKDLEEILASYVIYSKKSDFKIVCDYLIKSYPHRKDTITKNKEYILNNWIPIRNLFKNNLKCPMESQISHNLAYLFSSRPKGYSLKTLRHLIKLRMLFKNKHNIIKLFLYNYNKKETLEYNQEFLNFNIFNNSKNISFDDSLIPTNYNTHYFDNTVTGINISNYI